MEEIHFSVVPVHIGYAQACLLWHASIAFNLQAKGKSNQEMTLHNAPLMGSHGRSFRFSPSVEKNPKNSPFWLRILTTEREVGLLLHH